MTTMACLGNPEGTVTPIVTPTGWLSAAANYRTQPPAVSIADLARGFHLAPEGGPEAHLSNPVEHLAQATHAMEFKARNFQGQFDKVRRRHLFYQDRGDRDKRSRPKTY